MSKIKKETARSLFGLSQQQLATVLKVTRSQWSHYESGERSLPNDAGLLVIEMLSHMLSPEGSAFQNLSKPECADDKTRPILEKRLKENTYQLMVTERKIGTAQEKLDKSSKSVELMGFLNSTTKIKMPADPKTLRSIQSGAIAGFKENRSQLIVLEIDHELLLQEKAILEERLKKLP